MNLPALFLVLTLPVLATSDRPVRVGHEFDPALATRLRPGVSTLGNAVALFGSYPQRDSLDRGREGFATWFSALTSNNDSEWAVLEYRVDAEFDDQGVLVRLRVQDRRPHPDDRFDALRVTADATELRVQRSGRVAREGPLGPAAQPPSA